MANVVLSADALRAWDDADTEALTVIRALKPLDRPVATPDLAVAAANTAALGIWVLFRLAGRSEMPAARRTKAREVAAGLNACLNHVDVVGLADRCAHLGTLARDAPDPDRVFDVVLAAVSPDPLADLVRHFNDDAPDLAGRVVTLAAQLGGDGVVRVLEAGKLLDAAGPVAVVAETAKVGRLVCAWAAPYLVVVTERPAHGVLYRLPSGIDAGTMTENKRPPSQRELAHWYKGAAPPAEAAATLVACGLAAPPS